MIKVWDYLKEFENEKDEIYEAISNVLTSGCLVFGKNLAKFENNFSRYCDSSRGIGVGNCTDGIFVALKSMNIGEGDEVITVSNTAVPTVAAIHGTGAKTRFVDIRTDNYLMDVTKIESEINEKTKCIVCVHLYGQCVDMDAVNTLAKKYNLMVLEDCAQAHGATYKGRKAGSMGNASAFSFYPTKVLGAYGDGGMVVTSDHDLADRIERMRFYGMERKKMSSGHWNGKYYSIEHGCNSRLDELHAAILLKKLDHLDEYIDRRRQLADRYNEELSRTDIVLPVEDDHNNHVYYVYVVRHSQRDKIMNELRERNIHVNISYPWPIHIMEGYDLLGYTEGDLPNTEKMSQQIFSLPMYPTLTDDEQGYVIQSLKEILENL
jgi:aminotransferase EvaB